MTTVIEWLGPSHFSKIFLALNSTRGINGSRNRNKTMHFVDKPLQRILSGFVRMHVLHHAEEGDLFGNWMIEELRRHGYKISPGTLYPMLRMMEKDGWLKGRDEKGAARRRFYNITAKGRKALKEVRARLQELFREVRTKKKQPTK